VTRLHTPLSVKARVAPADATYGHFQAKRE